MMVNRFEEVTMGAAIVLREDFDAADLRRIAKGSKDASQSRRLLALAEIYAGGRRTEKADNFMLRSRMNEFCCHGPNTFLKK